MMTLSWVHCNNCYLIAVAQNTTKRETFAVASCGHIFCSKCIDKCVLGSICTICGRSPFIYEIMGRHMSEKTKKYFQTPDILLMNALQKINSIIKFQQHQYSIMRKNAGSMHEQMNNVADRCKKTAEICYILERNANTLATNMQHQHEILQNLNSSFADCSQVLKHFGEVSEIANTSGSVGLQHSSSQRNNEELSKTNSKFPPRNGSFNSILSLSGQGLSNFNTTISNPFIRGSDVDGDLSVSCLQSMKAPGNLATVFGDQDRSSATNLSQSVSSSNPYMRYISQKNAQSLGIIERNFTCSAATQTKSSGFSLQQLGCKRQPKVPENMQLSQGVFKMESSTHGLFNVRAHSLSRSPPRKNSRSADN